MKPCYGTYMDGFLVPGGPDNEERFYECLHCPDHEKCQAVKIVGVMSYIPVSLRARYIELGVLDKDDPRAHAPSRDVSDKWHNGVQSD